MGFKNLIEKTLTLSDEEYADFMVECFNTSRPPQVLKSIIKRISRKGNKSAKTTPVPKGEPEERQPAARSDGTGVVTSSSGNGPYPTTTKKTRAAGQSPLLFRGDLLPVNGLVFFDPEMLSLKPLSTSGPHRNVASSVAIVDADGELLLWSYIKWNEADVCSYYPTLTGITKEKLENGQSIDMVSHLAKLAFQGNLVVGFGLKNDLSALFLEAERKDDLSLYFVDNNEQPYSIHDLVHHFFGKMVQCGVHSAIVDARLTRDLYFKKEELIKNYPDFRLYPHTIERTKSKWSPSKEDRCTCQRNSVQQRKRKRGKKNKGTNKIYCYDDPPTDEEEFEYDY